MASNRPTDPAKISTRGAVLIWLLAFSPALLLTLLILLAVVVVLITQRDPSAQLLEILRIAVAWPMVALAIAVVFGLAFRDDIAASMSNIAVKIGLGGVEVITKPQPTPGPDESAQPAPSDAATHEPGPTEAHAAEAGQDQALAQLEQQSAWRMRMWWYWWLQNAGKSFVPRTVNVLRWLAAQSDGTADYAAYEQKWRPEVGAEQAAATSELSAILDALVRLDMIESPPGREKLTIRLAGRKFLEWLDGKWNPIADPLP